MQGDKFVWPIGSYEDVLVKVGETINLDCGDYDQPNTLIEFYDKKAYTKCDTSRAVTIDNTAEITFAEEGIRYFGCGDCGDGMKLRVTVGPTGMEPETFGKKKFVITKGSRCKKGKIIDKIQNKYLMACYFICNKRKDCYGFMHKAHNDKCILFGEPTYPTKRVGGRTCGWRAPDEDDGESEETDDNNGDSITVNILLTPDSTSGGKALLKLYLYDRLLADAPATLVTEHLVEVPRNARRAAFPVSINIDPSATQLGETFETMADGAYYIALDMDESELTYADSPVFGIAPGDSVTLELEYVQ
eukprot:CAMPEP_0185734338 /NCGR_PEP_ID=MMETSP1171-20130828/22204_1 /TAXON_ID=374046 /ORGANISM="Helicotheca tamensis, Strain CCMP826" /LENGTH=302 /DNA_ID=CAMNT_0028404309 /DNA_START=133 /DNA_END=1042 /DNA_ORIENTATION=+